jgi:effector-binding domain-containing protein
MKKVLPWIAVILISGIIWYLFIKPYDYLVRFEVYTNPGTVNQIIKLWDNLREEVEIQQQESLSELKTKQHFNDSTHIYLWNVEGLTDSTSLIKVYARDTENSLKNKILIPFSDTNFEKRTRNALQDFAGLLNEHLREIRVTILGEDDIPKKFCAYTTLETKQAEKAKGMMRDHNYLGGQLLKYGLELDGPPMVEVTYWDKEKDSIHFNFCYPIVKKDSLPELGDIRFKELPSKRALKAEFNGNYIFSDRAWYALKAYAEERGIETTDGPVEVFYNNPNFGGDELKWKTEVYMPIAEQGE